MDADHHLRVVGAETDAMFIVADLADRIERNFLPVDFRFRRDLTGDDDEIRRGQRLAGDTTLGILHEAGVEDRIGNLVTHLIGMPLRNRLGGKNMVGMNFTHRCKLLIFKYFPLFIIQM